MKPRLRLKGGVWSCASPRLGKQYTDAADFWNMRIGYGYTPQEAYRDWESA